MILSGELLSTLTPKGGYVFYFFAGPPATTLTALGTSQHYMCISRDKTQFDFAISELAIFSNVFPTD